MLNFGDFRTQITNRFASLEGVMPDADIAEEAGIDSLEIYELLGFIEEMAGLDSRQPLTGEPILLTIQDAYSYYQSLCNLS